MDCPTPAAHAERVHRGSRRTLPKASRPMPERPARDRRHRVVRRSVAVGEAFSQVVLEFSPLLHAPLQKFTNALVSLRPRQGGAKSVLTGRQIVLSGESG